MLRIFYTVIVLHLFSISVLFSQNTENQSISKDSLKDNNYSELVVNLGYANKVVYAGRNFSTNQYGLNGGITYYHKSGVYGSANGYWYSDSEPNYNLTTIGLGYSSEFLKNWYYNLSYDYLAFAKPPLSYNRLGKPIESTPNPLRHSFKFGSGYDFGPINVGLDYGFMTGDDQAHQLTASLGGYIPIYEVWIFSKIAFSPTLSAFWGTSNITYSRLPKALLLRLEQNGVSTQDDKVFGIMNYNIALPVQFKIKRFKLNFTYNFSFPQKINPIQDRKLQNISYFTTSISYSIGKR